MTPLLTDWDESFDWSFYAAILPDDLSKTEQELWDNAEGIEKKYAAKQINDFRNLEPTEPGIVIRP